MTRIKSLILYSLLCFVPQDIWISSPRGESTFEIIFSDSLAKTT